MLTKLFIGIVGLSWAGVLAAPAADNQGVQLTQLPDRVRVELNGQLFTEYFFKDVPRPYCYPVLGPGGLQMNRDWPMKDSPNEQHDHHHHRSLWFAHGSVNGKDFWDEEKVYGKIVHDGFIEVKSGQESGVLSAKNNWVFADGTVVCRDERTLRFYNPESRPERVMDFEITLFASNGALTFGDTKEGTMAVRLAETMRLHGKVGHGHIVNSNGVRDGATWGKRADWCDYFGPVNDQIVGLAIFDHPENPRHPTWWHVRDYGLFAANPFGQHHFENLPDAHAGDLTVPAGQSIKFRYRFYFHQGNEEQAKVADHYRDYVNGK